MSGAGFFINAELVGKLKAALDFFVTTYANAASGSWLSPAAWSASFDLRGHHADQTKLFENLQIALKNKAEEAEASDDLNSQFFSQIAALSLIGKIHQIITGTRVESGNNFPPAYAALVLKFEENLNLVKTPFEDLKKNIDRALNEETAFAMSAETSSEDFSIFLELLKSVWTIEAQEKFGIDLYSDLPDLVADSDKDQESKAPDHSAPSQNSFVIGWSHDLSILGSCELPRGTRRLLSLLATGDAVADGRPAPVGSRPLAPARMLEGSGVMPPLVPSVLDRPASASVAAAVRAPEVVVVEPFVEAAAAEAKKPKAPRVKMTPQQADLMLRAAELKAAEDRKAVEKTVVLTKQEQKELQDFLEKNRPSRVGKILKSDERMPRPRACELAETQLEKEFLALLAARKSSGCAAPR